MCVYAAAGGDGGVQDCHQLYITRVFSQLGPRLRLATC